MDAHQPKNGSKICEKARSEEKTKLILFKRNWSILIVRYGVLGILLYMMIYLRVRLSYIHIDMHMWARLPPHAIYAGNGQATLPPPIKSAGAPRRWRLGDKRGGGE